MGRKNYEDEEDEEEEKSESKPEKKSEPKQEQEKVVLVTNEQLTQAKLDRMISLQEKMLSIIAKK